MGTQSVLLVGGESAFRIRTARWLEEAGYEVMSCPGPTAPDACIGLRGLRCPLEAGADAIVLDVHLEVARGAGPLLARRILGTYLNLEQAVVVLDRPAETNAPAGGGFVVQLGPQPHRTEILQSVRTALRNNRPPGPRRLPADPGATDRP